MNDAFRAGFTERYREAALDWIDANQLGRRNLTPDQASLLRGRRYNRVKRQGARTDLTYDQNDHKLKTAETLADQHGVSEVTIRRDGRGADRGRPAAGRAAEATNRDRGGG